MTWVALLKPSMWLALLWQSYNKLYVGKLYQVLEEVMDGENDN